MNPWWFGHSQELRRQFQEADKDNSGEIDAEEATGMMTWSDEVMQW